MTRLVPRLPALLVCAGIGAAAGWLAHEQWGGPIDEGPRGGAGGVSGGVGQRLEARLELLGHGAWYGFTVDRPGTLRFTVDLPEGVTSTLLWGRLGAPAPGEPPHLPEPAATERIAIAGPMQTPLTRRPIALGPHVLFVEQPALAMGEMRLPARVLIELLPDAPKRPDPPR